MTRESHTFAIKSKSDVTKDFLAQVAEEGSCAGTFHSHDGTERPCIGGGLLCAEYERTVYKSSYIEMDEALGKLNALGAPVPHKDFGTPNPNAVVETVTCRPTRVAKCPCATAAKHSEYDAEILEALGVPKLPKLYPVQSKAVSTFKSKHVSLFVHGDSGGGKTVLAAACAVGFHRRVKVLVGDEISAEWRRFAFDNKPLDYTGLLILDDLDKTLPSDSFKEKLWYIFDRVAKNKVRLIVTTNLSPQAFAEKYTQGKDEAQSMIARLSKFEEVEL